MHLSYLFLDFQIQNDSKKYLLKLKKKCSNIKGI